MVVNYLANQRQGTQSTLTRTEVAAAAESRGDRRAQVTQDRVLSELRSGHTAALLFGPKPVITVTLNKKVKSLAMKSALSSKVQDNEHDRCRSDRWTVIKTKTIVEMLKALGSEKQGADRSSEVDAKVIASAANIRALRPHRSTPECI